MRVREYVGLTSIEKITEINRKLSIEEEGAPAVSLSVGVAFTDRKNSGKSQFTIYQNMR